MSMLGRCCGIPLMSTNEPDEVKNDKEQKDKDQKDEDEKDKDQKDKDQMDQDKKDQDKKDQDQKDQDQKDEDIKYGDQKDQALKDEDLNVGDQKDQDNKNEEQKGKLEKEKKNKKEKTSRNGSLDKTNGDNSKKKPKPEAPNEADLLPDENTIKIETSDQDLPCPRNKNMNSDTKDENAISPDKDSLKNDALDKDFMLSNENDTNSNTLPGTSNKDKDLQNCDEIPSSTAKEGGKQEVKVYNSSQRVSLPGSSLQFKIDDCINISYTPQDFPTKEEDDSKDDNLSNYSADSLENQPLPDEVDLDSDFSYQYDYFYQNSDKNPIRISSESDKRPAIPKEAPNKVAEVVKTPPPPDDPDKPRISFRPKDIKLKEDKAKLKKDLGQDDDVSPFDSALTLYPFDLDEDLSLSNSDKSIISKEPRDGGTIQVSKKEQNESQKSKKNDDTNGKAKDKEKTSSKDSNKKKKQEVASGSDKKTGKAFGKKDIKGSQNSTSSKKHLSKKSRKAGLTDEERKSANLKKAYTIIIADRKTIEVQSEDTTVGTSSASRKNSHTKMNRSKDKDNKKDKKKKAQSLKCTCIPIHAEKSKSMTFKDVKNSKRKKKVLKVRSNPELSTRLLPASRNDAPAMSFAQRNSAAVKIQSTFRGHMVRKQLNDNDTNQRNNAAVKIQSTFRGHMTRKQLNDKYSNQRKNAAIKIQSTFRGHMTRKQLSDKYSNQRNDAAVKIQSTFRGHMARKQLNDKYSNQRNDAAIKIQSTFRGHMARKQLKDKNLEELEINDENIKESDTDLWLQNFENSSDNKSDTQQSKITTWSMQWRERRENQNRRSSLCREIEIKTCFDFVVKQTPSKTDIIFSESQTANIVDRSPPAIEPNIKTSKSTHNDGDCSLTEKKVPFPACSLTERKVPYPAMSSRLPVAPLDDSEGITLLATAARYSVRSSFIPGELCEEQNELPDTGPKEYCLWGQLNRIPTDRAKRKTEPISIVPENTCFTCISSCSDFILKIFQTGYRTLTNKIIKKTYHQEKGSFEDQAA